MARWKGAQEIKTLWRGKPQTVTVHPAMKEIEIEWHKEYASIILVTGSPYNYSYKQNHNPFYGGIRFARV